MSLVRFKMPFPITVNFAPEWEDIHQNYSPLVNLSHCTFTLAPSEEADDLTTRTPVVASPLYREEEAILRHLMETPVNLEELPVPSEEDVAEVNQYVSAQLQKEEFEKEYITFVFSEYKKRKSIEAKYDEFMEELWEALEVAKKNDLPLYLRNLLEEVRKAETKAREEVETSYANFINWVEEMTPQWLEAVHAQELESAKREEAKKVALAAAKEALTQELLEGRKLPMPVAAAPVIGHPYSPGFDTTDDSLSSSALRSKAIKMLENEEIEVKKRHQSQLEQLKEQEAILLQQLKEKEQQKEAGIAARREEEMARRYNELLEQESTIAARLSVKEEEMRQKRLEKEMLLEHLKAEEELLQKKLKEKEEREKAIREEEERLERKRKQEALEELRKQEALLQQRVREKERMEEEKRRLEAEREAKRREQDRLLRESQEEKERQERERQLRYLEDQEREYKARVRSKELAELQALEQRRLAEAWAAAPPPPSHPYPHHYPPASPYPPPPGMYPGYSPPPPSPWGAPPHLSSHSHPPPTPYPPGPSPYRY